MCDSKFSLIEDGAVQPLAPISSREVIACNSHRENFVPVDAFEDLKLFWKQKQKRRLGRFAEGFAKNLDCKNNFSSVFTHSRRTSHEVAETQNSVSAADLEVRHKCFRVISGSFNSFLQCFLCSKESALLCSINKQRTNQPLSQDEAAQCPTCHKMLMSIIITIPLALSNSRSYQAT
jgi:hypothetical protein